MGLPHDVVDVLLTFIFVTASSFIPVNITIHGLLFLDGLAICLKHTLLIRI